ncbi:MAG: hypothetical protein U5J98_06945 [Halobacteriales archaeon]|nr:hypothetical protein [Halobacteriales archaeon]
MLFGTASPWVEIDQERTVRTNSIQLYSSAFGELAGDYELVIVYWEKKQTQVQTDVGNRSVTYAANQTVERKTVTIEEDELYSYTNVSLPPHVDRTMEVTMWLERGGERAFEAQWTFNHRTNPLYKSLSINSFAGAWAFSFSNALGPGIVGGVLGLIGSQWVLRRIGRGPGYGVVAWGIAIGIVSLFIVPTAGFYYQVAVVLKNMPKAMGGVVFIIVFSIGLTLHEPARKVGFWQRHLFDAKTMGTAAGGGATTDGGHRTLHRAISESLGNKADVFDQMAEGMFADLPEVPIIRTQDGVQGARRGHPAGLRAAVRQRCRVRPLRHRDAGTHPYWAA